MLTQIQEQNSVLKEQVLLYTLSGAMILIGISWTLMFFNTIKNKKTL